MIKINYESDFKLTEKTEEQRFADVPFKFVYATNSGAYTASYDGEVYTRCKRNEDGSVTVIFNDHGLGVGKLRVRREFFIPDTDFPDGVYNVVSNDTTDVILVEGKTEGFDVENSFRPPYITDGEGGGEVVSVEIVDNLESDATDKALSARQGKVLKGMIPTQVSELENDEGYITEIPEDYATKEDVGEVVSGKQDALTLTVKDNGNIVIGNISGQSKEFMPATPSGDPMHWAYVSGGAEYNDSGADIVKDAPWKALADTDEEKRVIHKVGCWYLNGVGDITTDVIRHSYNKKTLLYDLNKRASHSHDVTIRTIYPAYRGTSVSGLGPTRVSTLFGCTNLETFLLSDMESVLPEPDYTLSLSASYEFFNCGALKAIGQVTTASADPNRFVGCTSLRYIWMYALKFSTNLKDSPLISNLSIKYMINYATPSSAITITLHPDAYARLAGDADIVAALEAQPLVTLVSA